MIYSPIPPGGRDGFAEGEGCFTVAKRGDLQFVVTQSTEDVNVLNYIMNSLGFGNVIKQSIKSNTHRFIVQDRANLVLISLIFNGPSIWYFLRELIDSTRFYLLF